MLNDIIPQKTQQLLPSQRRRKKNNNLALLSLSDTIMESGNNENKYIKSPRSKQTERKRRRISQHQTYKYSC